MTEAASGGVRRILVVVGSVVAFGVLLLAVGFNQYSIAINTEQDGHGRELFVDPVPGGADEALAAMGLETFVLRYSTLEELSEVTQFRLVSVGPSACPSGNVRCLADLFEPQSWVSDVEVVSAHLFEYRVGECRGVFRRQLEGDFDFIPEDVEVDRSTIWSNRIKCSTR